MDLTVGKQVKIIEGEKVTAGVIQKLFPSGTDTVVQVRLETGGLKCHNASEMFEDSEGVLTVVIEVVQVAAPAKKKGLFSIFKR